MPKFNVGIGTTTPLKTITVSAQGDGPILVLQVQKSWLPAPLQNPG